MAGAISAESLRQFPLVSSVIGACLICANKEIDIESFGAIGRFQCYNAGCYFLKWGVCMMDSLTAPALNEYLIAAPGEPIVNITAYTARLQAGSYVGSHVSHLMGGGEPSLLLAQGRVVWRVPILLSSPRRGILGQVASVDIDARTGQLILPAQFIEELESHAQALLDSTSLPPAA